MTEYHFIARLKYAAFFILLMLMDIGPVPVTALIGLYVVIQRPRWFKNMIDEIYR